MEPKGRRYSDDEVIKAWPWFGGAPGRAARKIFAIWVTALVLLVVLTIYEIATLHLCTTVILIFVIAIVALAPTLFLIGSRI